LFIKRFEAATTWDEPIYIYVCKILQSVLHKLGVSCEKEYCNSSGHI